MDMDIAQILRLLTALSLVLALMGGLALLLRKLGVAGAAIQRKAARRLQLIESLPLDPRRTLVIVQRDERQHLLILGANGETVVETNIQNEGERPPPQAVFDSKNPLTLPSPPEGGEGCAVKANAE